jgi:hypothetical protein
MARSQTLKKKGRSSGSAKKEEPAHPKSGGNSSERPSRPAATRPVNEATRGQGREARPVSTRAALGFKDEE